MSIATISFEAIPGELKLLPQWVCWRREVREGKPTKVPYRADGAGKASTTDPATWATFQDACSALSRCNYDGIGFVFSSTDVLYVGVDLDHCRNAESEKIEDWAKAIISSLNSYSEVTPSGTGVHILVKGKLPPGGRKKGNIEMYDSGRYFTITGHHIEGTPTTIEKRQEQLDQLHAQVFPKTEPISKPGGNDNRPPVDLADTELIAKAENAKNGAAFSALWRGDTSAYGGDDSRADLALCSMLAFWTGNDQARIDSLFRQSGLYREKWEREDYRARTIGKAIEGTGETYTPEHARQPSTMYGEAHPATKQGVTLEDVLSKFTTYYHLPDTGHIEIMLATIAANLGDGDPVWLLIVAPPGWGKTEPINAVSHLPRMFPVAVLTEASLLSGTPRKDRAQEAKGGLLTEMGSFGILLVKDFSGMLTMQKDSRGPILSALREVYDGSWTRYVGVEGGRKLHWEGKCGLIGAATPSIDQHYAVMATLGERFNFYRIPEEEENSRAAKALKYAGQEKAIRADLQGVLSDFFRELKPSNQLPVMSEGENKRLIALASFATRCRSAVERENYQSREIQLIPGIESPSRMVKVLALLLRGLADIGVNKDRAWKLLQKVSLDSMPVLRGHVLIKMLSDSRDTWTTTDLATELGYPTTTTRRSLEDLSCYGIITRTSQGEGKADQWSLTKWTRETYQVATTEPEPTLPEIRDTTIYQTPKLQTPNFGKGSPDYPAKPCLCGSTDFWLRGNEWVCMKCHPEPSKEGGSDGHTT